MAKKRGVKLYIIPLGKPTQNAFVESCHDKFREFCLDLKRFASIGDTQSNIDTHRMHYYQIAHG